MSLRQQHKARTRAQILAAALELIEEQGLAATTTREMAQRAGISYPTLYNYFPSKNQVVQALLAEDLEAWGVAVDGCIKRYNGHLLDTLAEINQLGLDQFHGPKTELWREVGTALTTDTEAAGERQTLNPASHERFHALLAIAQGTGELQEGIDLHLLAHTLFCLSDYTLLQHLTTSAPDAARSLANLQDQLTLLLTPYLRRRNL